MGILRERAALLEVSRLYYESGLSQKEISSLLGISRPQVSRALCSARQQGLVHISIRDDFAALTRAERALIAAYHLSDAFVALAGQSDLLAEFGRQCAPQLEVYLADRSTVGVSSGKTLAALVQEVDHLDRKGVEFIPLVGGVAARGCEWQANRLARALAEKASGTYRVLNAPVLVQNEAVREMLVSEPGVQAVLEKGRRCDVALVSIGQISEGATAYQAGALGGQDIWELLRLGAAASVCASFFDRQGRPLDLPVSRRSIGYQLRRPRRGRVIAAVAGAEKLEAARAVLGGGYVDVLFTTLDFAQSLLNEL